MENWRAFTMCSTDHLRLTDVRVACRAFGWGEACRAFVRSTLDTPVFVTPIGVEQNLLSQNTTRREIENGVYKMLFLVPDSEA